MALAFCWVVDGESIHDHLSLAVDSTQHYHLVSAGRAEKEGGSFHDLVSPDVPIVFNRFYLGSVFIHERRTFQ